MVSERSPMSVKEGVRWDSETNETIRSVAESRIIGPK